MTGVGEAFVLKSARPEPEDTQCALDRLDYQLLTSFSTAKHYATSIHVSKKAVEFPIHPDDQMLPPGIPVSEEMMQRQKDAQLYIEMIDVLSDAPLQDKISGWEKFLAEHPNSYFADEIRANLTNQKRTLANKEKKMQEEDARAYFSTIDKARSLSLLGQITLWRSYLDKNPDSYFANNARSTLNRLRLEQQWQGNKKSRKPKKKPTSDTSKPQPKKTSQAPPQDRDAELDDKSPYLNPERALFLAAVPGLIIPGIGHLYAEQDTIGIMLSVIRVVGIGLTIIGLSEDETAFTVPGLLLAGSTYAVDVFMAPIHARNYNNALDPLPEDEQPPAAQREAPTYGLKLSFNF